MSLPVFADIGLTDKRLAALQEQGRQLVAQLGEVAARLQLSPDDPPEVLEGKLTGLRALAEMRERVEAVASPYPTPKR